MVGGVVVGVVSWLEGGFERLLDGWMGGLRGC